jgi:sucrose-phosphate synthase
MEARYHLLSHRIDVEERMLRDADLVIASTRHEVEKGYELYDAAPDGHLPGAPARHRRRALLPVRARPRTRTSTPATTCGAPARMRHEIARFLNHPDKPLILAISRPDKRKNIEGLVTAYGEDKELQSSPTSRSSPACARTSARCRTTSARCSPSCCC